MKIRKRKRPAGGTPHNILTDEDHKALQDATRTAAEGLGLPQEGVSATMRHKVQEARLGAMSSRRRDASELAAYIGRDSETGKRIAQEEIHESFHILADHYPRLIVMAHPESGKTTQLGVLRCLHILGNDPNKRIAVVSKIKSNATKITRAIRSYIEKSEELAEVFPNLIRGEKWEEDFFTVARDIVSKDPSVQALGLDGTIIGSRVDVLIFDDILDDENTRTASERAKVFKRIQKGFLDRLTARGVVIFLTNAWHPEDAAHLLAKKANWHLAKFPVIDEEGVPTWPLKWSKERVEYVREEFGPLEFARAFLCKARDEGESPFEEEDLNAAVRRAEEMGIDLVHEVRPDELPPGAHIYTGVDLAVTKGPGSHLTALVTVLLWPDQSRQLLWVEAGRWSSSEIRDRVLDHDRRYRSTFIVENNAAQRWILDIIMNQADIPEDQRRIPELVPFTTGKNKAHSRFGVEGLAVEFSLGVWVWPETGEKKAVQAAQEARQAMAFYSRGAHTGDHLMALWFAREGCRRGVNAGRPEREGAEHDLDHTMPKDDDGEGVMIFGGKSSEESRSIPSYFD